MTITLPPVAQQRGLPEHQPAPVEPVAHGPACGACGHRYSLHGDRAVTPCANRAYGPLGLNWQGCGCGGWVA